MDKSAKIWMIVAMLLILVILVMTWLLFALPAPERVPTATTTPEKPATSTPTTQKPPVDQPLSTRVSVTSPQPNTTVGPTFAVTGKAPGNWFFEATFPIQIRDANDNVIARTHASAQGEWMTTELVAFSSTINIDGGYTGPATLVLMRDNPSGLPENDDALEIPIVIK